LVVAGIGALVGPSLTPVDHDASTDPANDDAAVVPARA